MYIADFQMVIKMMIESKKAVVRSVKIRGTVPYIGYSNSTHKEPFCGSLVKGCVCHHVVASLQRGVT